MMHVQCSKLPIRLLISLLAVAGFFTYLGYCVLDRADFYARDAQTEQAGDQENDQEDSGRKDEKQSPPPKPIQPPVVSAPRAEVPLLAIPESGSRVREALGGASHTHDQSGGLPFGSLPRVP